MNDTGTALTERLTNAEREQRWANQRPRDAATLIVIDPRGPKLLMGKRHESHKFMPGKFVFPGGRIEASDRKMVCAGSLDDRTDRAMSARVTRPSSSKNRALALAAIRETYEETGIMLGSKEYGRPDCAVEGPWADFVREGVFPELDALQFIARAVTPPRRPKRFDTRFFAVSRESIAHTVEGVVGETSELVELTWVSIAEAKRLDLPTITTVVLDELEARIAAGFSPMLPVPYYHMVRGRFVRELV